MRNFLPTSRATGAFVALSLTLALGQASMATNDYGRRRRPRMPMAERQITLNVVTSASGFTVYTFDKDEENESYCYDSCELAWPPLKTTLSVLPAPFGVITRKDGSSQVTRNGKPLYTYAEDKAAGDITGDGVGGIWHLVHR